jgi:hypothetical protein
MRVLCAIMCLFFNGQSCYLLGLTPYVTLTGPVNVGQQGMNHSAPKPDLMGANTRIGNDV